MARTDGSRAIGTGADDAAIDGLASSLKEVCHRYFQSQSLADSRAL